MPLTARETTQTRELIPEGLHLARCVGVVDIGTQEGFQGKHTGQVLLMWETPEQRYKFEWDGRTIDAARVITATYTLSLGDKANLRHVLEAWRGRAFSPGELKNFDLAKILNALCQLQIFHRTSGKGNLYAMVRNVLPWPRNAPASPAERPLSYFSFEDADRANPRIPEEIPAWIQDKIRKSPEWQELTLPAQPAPANETPDGSLVDTADDLPW